ncbi:MAG: hypothetical protein KGZ39_08085 [Simkania sp.]|nr:hypothetical protein [Simkania sp.]
MNILITTFSLLLVFSISASLFWREAKNSTETLRIARGFFEAARITQNKSEDKRFQRARSSEPSTVVKKESKSLSTHVPFVSHRLMNPPVEQGRVHIACLQMKEYAPILQPIFKRLFEELYGHTSWYDAKKMDQLLSVLITTTNELHSETFMTTLDAELYPLWYRMLKGTQLYNTETRVGYPPLGDFVDFSSSKVKHFCHFPFAPLPILRALLGKDIAIQIVDIETLKWQKDHKRRYCTKQELLPLLSKHAQCATLTHTVETFCYFSPSVGKRSFVQGIEEHSGIALRRMIKDVEQEAK